MDLLQALKISSSGLSAQRTKLNIISENLANSETTRTKEGGPYKRQMVVFKAKPIPSFRSELDELKKSYDGVQVSEIVTAQEEFRMVYKPSHPDADPVTGYVAMPNVNHLTEMTDMMTARRAYEANVTAIENTRSLINKALEIGK
ncbi:MAG: flagellar basal body rod protein FlgC [Desulfobacterium sp.]|nr:flagellar basal body rod protein FlgC [Desulfobacterium sp.]